MNKTIRKGLLPVGVALLMATSVHGIARAQVPAAQTGTASPGRVEEQVRIPSGMPRTVPSIEVKGAEGAVAPPGAEKISFTLNTLTLDGVSVYSSDELRAVYQDKLGAAITLADLYTIAADLTRQYRNDGYVLTQIVVPPQTIEGGTAKLRVVEGYIDHVEVRGDVNGLDFIRTLAAQLKTGTQAVNIRQLERSLLLINDLPGITARGVLSASKTQPGAADMVILVERKPYDAQVSVDNYGTRYLGPLQLGAAISLNSQLGANEKITAQVVATPNHDLNNELYYFGLAYEQPVWDRGTTIEVFANNTYTDPGFDLEQFDVHGKSTLMGVRLKHPFIRTRNMNLSGRATFDMRRVSTKNNVEDRRRDNIRAARLGGRFEILDTILGDTATAYNTFDAEVSHGLDIWGATPDSNVNKSRPAAENDFYKMEFEFQRLQRYSTQVNLLLGISGQVSDGPLYSSEEFGVGGQAYGRGFDPSEILGDDGIAGKFELQWNDPYKISLLETYQLYGFYDIGHVWNGDATTSSQEQETAASVGFGIRGDFNKDTAGGLVLAFPLNRNVQTMRDSDPRLFFSLLRKF